MESLTVRDKVAHLYRRFGLGATQQELDAGEKLGVERTLHELVEYSKTPDTFKVSPHEFVWRGKEEADLGSWRYRCWWIFKMLTTKRPLQEKLTMFWHNHFAAADNKVENGPMMLGYLLTLHNNADGKFPDLLKAISKDPAMMRYLDMTRSIRGHPNENFPREVMELFSLGIGNYTENDVKEVSRALTGWGYVDIFYELHGKADDKMKESLQYDRPFSSFMYMPGMHDPTPKTILGKTDHFDGDQVLELLALHPATARRISKKLWEFFAYKDPEPQVLDRLQRVFLKTGGDTKALVLAIGHSPEFWSDRCVRSMIKSPLDFCIPVARQMGVGEALMELRDPAAAPTTQIAKPILDNTGYVGYLMDRQGLSLLNPPDVSGWKWQEAWISADTMLERYGFRGIMVYGRKGPDSGVQHVFAQVKKAAPKDSASIAQAMAAVFDVRLPEPVMQFMTAAFEKSGGLKTLTTPQTFIGPFVKSMALIVATPEFNVC